VTSARFQQITSRYRNLRIGVIGDICLDRYLEIDPAKQERSIETGLAVHNVVNVRTSPGAAGTVINNLCALGVKQVYPIGVCGDDGEGMELGRALEKLPQVSLKHFHSTPLRRTFTYTKPLVLTSGKPPRELNRLDLKNWTRTPPAIEKLLVKSLAALTSKVDAIIVLDQVDRAGTGVVTTRVLQAIKQVAARLPSLVMLADSRRGLRGFPPLIWKMNRAELARHGGRQSHNRLPLSLAQVQSAAVALARKNQQSVLVTLAQDGVAGASAAGEVFHARALPVRGRIDIVGAGDAVTANLAAAFASGAAIFEAMELAMCAASIVIHQLGTTGTASTGQIKGLLSRQQLTDARSARRSHRH
jgi:rfaE bifunctional protein kinase chain/domain